MNLFLSNNISKTKSNKCKIPGGYTPRNVARAWTYETTLAVDHEVPDGLFPRRISDIIEFFKTSPTTTILNISAPTTSCTSSRQILRTTTLPSSSDAFSQDLFIDDIIYDSFQRVYHPESGKTDHRPVRSDADL